MCSPDKNEGTLYKTKVNSSLQPNLYPGPMEHIVTGPQVSMVDLYAPDLECYAKALSTTRIAELKRPTKT